MLRSRSAREIGERALIEDRYAPTTQRTRAARIKTLRALIREAGVELAPVMVCSINTVAAALKAGGYRTGNAYLGLWESLHREAGFDWTADLAQARLWAKRSMERGLGPARRAATVTLENTVNRGKVKEEHLDMVIVGALWMLRGAEIAALLIEQVVGKAEASAATLVLGAHKTNIVGSWCERSLRCSGKGTDLGARIGPAHAAVRILAWRRAQGCDGKDPLFPGVHGKAMTHSEARERIRQACGEMTLSEHSLRRTGAQFYARRGVALPVIQFLGRWGSAAAERYVADAPAGRAAWAPLLAATEFDLTEMVGGMDAGKVPGIDAIARVLGKLVRTEVAKAQHSGGGASSGGGTERAARVIGGTDTEAVKEQASSQHFVKSGQTGVGHVVRHAGAGPHPRLWETACGWRYGLANHVQICAQEVSCARCAVVVDKGPRG